MSGISERDLLAPLPLMSDARLLTKEECAWLAGFIDGEGTIGLAVGRKHGTIHVYLTIPNTNVTNMAHARVLLRAVLGRDVRVSKPQRRDRRPIYVIAVQNHREIKVILESILPWLVGKRPQADLMLDYIRAAPSRLTPKSVLTPGRTRAKPVGRYTDQHYGFVTRMKRLNRRFAPGEWTDGDVLPMHQTAWPDRSVEDADDELKRWWKLHFGS